MGNYIDSLLEKLEGRTILVTGATGLIGYTLISSILNHNKISCREIKVKALVRNIEKAKKLFSDYENNSLQFIVSTIEQFTDVDGEVDFVIHAASQTSSKMFVEQPVETIKSAVLGTMNVLELSRFKKVKSFVYLSSMEVYGSPQDDRKIYETAGTDLNTMVVRSNYPESKRICENLCCSYFSEYGVPAKVVRLTQTFGPGVQYNDGRVFAEFARCVIEKKNIVLHTKGETKRNYLYTEDAVAAILTVLLNGKNGEAYNAANEETYCSIYEMARMVAKNCANGEIDVVIQCEDVSKFGYAPVLKMNLDTSKLRNLGWKPNVDLEEMFRKLCNSMIKSKL